MNYRDIFFKNNFHRNISSNDIENMFVKKFHRIHDIRYIDKRIYVKYSRPYDVVEYYKHLGKIESVINANESSMYFRIKLLQTRGYPDYIICDGEVFDLPLIIDLDFDL
jgi:hypothetical protein